MKISIVIPAYNEAEYLRICLDALKNQTIKPYEILVVDNNSSDETSKIAKSYKGVKVLFEPEQGIIPARNRGFDAATGEVIARLDAESKPNPDWLEEIQRVLKNDEFVAVTGPFYYYDMPLQKVGEQGEWAIRTAVQKMLKDFQFLSGANMALRREVWKELRSELCKNHDIHEDLDIALHLTKRDLKIFYDEKLVVGTSARRIEDPPKRFYGYVQRFTNTYREHNLNPSAARIPMALYLSFYPGLKLIRFFYDADQKRFSLVKLKRELEKLID